ncbi:MAG: LPXTG cell wall anchor domain-containing protein [Peptostreptococcaceae bacterium]
MKLSKKIIQILTITSIISLFPISSHADKKDITIDPTFTYEDGLWQPGRGEVKEFNITNHKDKDIVLDRLFVELTYSRNWKIDKVLDIDSIEFKEMAEGSTFVLMHEGQVLYERALQELSEERVITIPRGVKIEAGQSEPFEMIIHMDESIENEAQALQNEFSIGVAYKMDTGLKPPIDPPPIKPPVDPEGPTGPTKPTDPDTDVDGENDKLPQTGGIVNSASLVVLGAVAIGAGVVLNKKSEEEGGKHNE